MSSLHDASPGDTYGHISGADTFNMTSTGRDAYNNSTRGMNFRVELSQVPLPAALWLFVPVIIGFAGLRYQAKN